MRDLSAPLAFTACCLIWGSTFLVIRIGNDALPPLWAAGLRLVAAGLILSGIEAARGRSLPRGRALKYALGYGFLEFGVNFSLLYWGEVRVPSAVAAILFSTIPVSTAVLARAIGLERLTALKVAGTLVSVAGVAILFAERLGPSAGFARATGAGTGGAIGLLPLLAVLGASIAASAATVLLKHGPPQSAVGANAAGSWIGAAVCLAASFALGEPHPVPASGPQWWPLVYLTIAGSVVAFVAMIWLLSRWPVTRVSLIAVVIPIVAVVLGALARGERLGATGLGGAAVILAGVALVIRGEREEAARQGQEREISSRRER
jgi:drug/metabolite transporter (DMT)-like permease